MSEGRLKVGDLVRYTDKYSQGRDDLAIILEICNPKGRFVAKLFWQKSSTYETRTLEQLVTVEEYERSKETAKRKAEKAKKK